MGLFGNRTRVQVAATAARVITDDLLPSSIKSGVLRALFNDGNIVDHMLEDLASGIGTRANRMFSYASQHYAYGLPRPVSFESTDGKTIITNTISMEMGQPVTLDYYRFGPLNNLHWGWYSLWTFYSYDPKTNQFAGLSAAKGTPVYLKDMVVVVTDATLDELKNGSLDFWGTPPNAGYTPARTSLVNSPVRMHTPFQVDPTAAMDYIRVEYVWMEDGVLQEASFTFNVDVEGINTKDFYQVKFSYGDGQSGWWNYEAGSGTYVDVDTIFDPTGADTYPGFANFFPFTYFRFDNQRMDTDKTSAGYQTSKKMLKYLGLDYQTMIDAIHENPDVGEVDQAMMMMAVPANSEHPLELQYLYDFFRIVHSQAGQAAVDWGKSPTEHKIISGNRADIDPLPDSVIVLEDKKFKMTLGYRAVFKRRKPGTIGAVGSYTGTVSNEELVQKGTLLSTGEQVLWRSFVPCHIYRYQQSAGSYDEIMVYGLTMTYHIYGQYSDIGDGDEAILMVPVDYSVTQGYSIPEREELYARSLHYVFNSIVITKLKWYETSAFKWLVIIVMVVITIYTQGATWKELAAALASGSAVAAIAALKAILIGILKYLAFSAAFKLFVKEVGTKLAVLTAVVAAAFGFYEALDLGSLGQVWAENLLNVASGLINAAQDVMQEALLGLVEEAKAFGLYVEEQTELLEQTKELLRNDNVLSPFIFFGESPEDYYQRTIHSGNIGVLGIDAISTFVESALTLPKLNDTVGATYD